jgi:hypothetical protein
MEGIENGACVEECVCIQGVDLFEKDKTYKYKFFMAGQAPYQNATYRVYGFDEKEQRDTCRGFELTVFSSFFTLQKK